MSLAARMLEQLDRDPARVVLSVVSSESGRVVSTSTAQDLLHSAGAWSSRFAEAGLSPGDRIALSPDRNADAVALHLAALATGLPIVPASDALADAETVALLEASRPALVVTSDGFAGARPRARAAASAPWWTIDGPGPGEEGVRRLSAAAVRDDDDALVLFTSGTTGRPKSVPLSRGNLASNLDSLASLWRRSSDDRVLHMLPLHHFHGLVLGLYGSLLAGNEIFLLSAFDARAALDAIARHDITLIFGVPTMYARMIDAARPDDDLSSLRVAISGSAPLGEGLWNRFLDRFGVRLVERYGLTETGIIASNPIDRPRGGSVGFPLPQTDVRIFADGRYLARPDSRGARGEICVRGPSVTRGYGNDAEANRAAFRDGFFHTGDLGRFDADGYLWIDGRLKELIIVGGSNVVPGEVERVLAGVQGVADVAVVGAPHVDLGEVAAAVVVATDPDRARLEGALRAASESGLARYKQPRSYLFVDELPRNAMGKVDRARLARLVSAFTADP